MVILGFLDALGPLIVDEFVLVLGGRRGGAVSWLNELLPSCCSRVSRLGGGGGGGVPFPRETLLPLLLMPAMLVGAKVGVCVRECESGAETKEAVELVVPDRRGSGGGRSSLYAPSKL